MPNLQYAAQQIINYLLQDPESPLPVDDSRAALFASGDWLTMANGFGVQYLMASWELSPRADYWQGVSCIYQGAHHHSQGYLLLAADWYRQAEQAFERAAHPFAQSVALMALGRVFHAHGDHSLAFRMYDQSRQISLNLNARAHILHNAPAARLYDTFCSRLQDLCAQVSRPARSRFLRVVEASAGEPLYEPGDYCDTTLDVIWIDDQQYRLLSIRNRQPTKRYFLLNERVFLVYVNGHSMNGGAYEIHDKDLLLVKYQETSPDDGQVAVFQEGESSGRLVKIFRPKPGRVVLESANPKYKDRTYDDRSSSLRALGIAQAILQLQQGD